MSKNSHNNSLAVRLVDNARKLDYIIRSSRMPIIQKQSVSEHSFHVAFLAVIAAEDLKTAGAEFDELKLIKMSLLHDVEEGMTGDIVHPVKNHNPDMKRIVNETADAMWEDMTTGISPFAPGLLSHNFMRYCESGDSLEKRVMKILDMLDFVIYMHHEFNSGNRHNISQWHLGSVFVKDQLNKLIDEGICLFGICDIFAAYGFQTGYHMSLK